MAHKTVTLGRKKSEISTQQGNMLGVWTEERFSRQNNNYNKLHYTFQNLAYFITMTYNQDNMSVKGFYLCL